MSQIQYATNKASAEEIAKHLKANADAFVPNLNNTVDIENYSNKIKSNATTFEARAGEKLIGLIACYFNDPNAKNAFITNVSVDKEHHAKGIAAKLMESCILYAEEKGFGSILLEVNIENKNAKRLYEKFGFESMNVQDTSEFYQLQIQ